MRLGLWDKVVIKDFYVVKSFHDSIKRLNMHTFFVGLNNYFE